MALSQREGVFWVSLENYEGPAELMSFFIERGKLLATDVSLEPLLQAALPLLESLPLEERMEVLLLIAHLMWLKAKALLPTLPDTSDPAPPPDDPPPAHTTLSPALLAAWETHIAQARWRLSRPPDTRFEPVPYLRPIYQIQLLKAYLSIQTAYQKRLQRYAVQMPRLSLEAVAQTLSGYFTQSPQTTLSALFEGLPREPLYWAIALFLLLSWIQEGKLQYQPISLWEGHLIWQGA